MESKSLLRIFYIALLIFYTLFLIANVVFYSFLIITISIPERFNELALVPLIILLALLVPLTFYIVSIYFLIKKIKFGEKFLLFGIIPITLYTWFLFQKPRALIIPQLFITFITFIIVNSKAFKDARYNSRTQFGQSQERHT